jgi:hypothetical protein
VLAERPDVDLVFTVDPHAGPPVFRGVTPAHYRDLDDALAAHRLDLVVIATPADSHADLATAVLNGSDALVLVEKPLVPDLASVDRLSGVDGLGHRPAHRAGPVGAGHGGDVAAGRGHELLGRGLVPVPWRGGAARLHTSWRTGASSKSTAFTCGDVEVWLDHTAMTAFAFRGGELLAEHGGDGRTPRKIAHYRPLYASLLSDRPDPILGFTAATTLTSLHATAGLLGPGMSP